MLIVQALFLLLGPIHYLLDLAWMPCDDQRQALRNKLAGTYVVRRQAELQDREGYFIVCYTFLFREVSVE